MKDFPMEGAMMSDLVAMEIMGALVTSGAGNHIQANPVEAIVKIGFEFAKEFLKQREDIHNGKDVGDEVGILVPKTAIIS